MLTDENTVTITDIPEFLNVIDSTLEIVDSCRDLLLPFNVRQYFHDAVQDLKQQGTADGYEGFHTPTFSILRQSGVDDYRSELLRAGLTGVQSTYKFAEVEASANKFHTHGGIRNLRDLLKKGVIILKSLINAIPVLGSALTELIDFVIENLKQIERDAAP